MPDFGRWNNGGDPSLNEINRTDRFLDALASQQPVYSTDPSEAELAHLLAGWRDEIRTPPLMRPVTPRDAAVALTRAIDSRKRTRTSMALVGSVAAAVLCIGGFGAVVASSGPGDSLYGLHTALFGEQTRTDQVTLASQQLAEVQQLIDTGQWQAAQDKLQAVTTTVATVNDVEQKQELVTQWQQLTVKVDAKDAAATLPPGAPPPQMPEPVVVAPGSTTTTPESSPPSETSAATSTSSQPPTSPSDTTPPSSATTSVPTSSSAAPESPPPSTSTPTTTTTTSPPPSTSTPTTTTTRAATTTVTTTTQAPAAITPPPSSAAPPSTVVQAPAVVAPPSTAAPAPAVVAPPPAAAPTPAAPAPEVVAPPAVVTPDAPKQRTQEAPATQSEAPAPAPVTTTIEMPAPKKRGGGE
jgi:anti-sigma-D factor RsdA-like protein